MSEPWRETVSWAALRAGAERHLAADEHTRARIAEALDLEGLERFEADVAFGPWLDGAVVEGVIRAVAIRRCGVSLELFPEEIEEPFRITLVPEGSIHAPRDQTEVEIDLESEDPPEVVAGDSVDLGRRLVEALALALDPFPRKPGVVFDPPPTEAPESPFAALAALKSRDPGR